MDMLREVNPVRCKRYQPGSWAPKRMAWAVDNRTVGYRVVGHGPSSRIENRMPGADANPYIAIASNKSSRPSTQQPLCP
jgi:glutamine synthetase